MISSYELIQGLTHKVEAIAIAEYSPEGEKELIDIAFNLSRLESRIFAVMGIGWVAKRQTSDTVLLGRMPWVRPKYLC